MCTAIVIYSRQIPLSKTGKNKGKYFTTVSYWWYDFLNQWNWSAVAQKHTCYAARYIYNKTGCDKPVLMHRVILCANVNELSDHKDRNGLNNQNDNIRACNESENQRNKTTWGKSGLKGVYYDESFKKWKAYISINGKIKTIGRFRSATEAAVAYDNKSKELYGEFANLNYR